MSLENCCDEFALGNVVDGLVIEKTIGEGAMANLYLVRDVGGERRVIKVPRQSLKMDPVCLVAFENELRLAPYLEDFKHAYMPKIRGQTSNQYLVMDYIQGVDLWSFIKKNGPLTETDTVNLGKMIVRAVAELHQRRIVHLDLKLSNVMITPAGEVRLIDFGLANHLDLHDLIYESFRDPKGTPAYIAPEQFMGVRDEPRSDLFSLGVMLFELATGQLPYPDAKSVLDVIIRIKRKPASPQLHNPALSHRFAQIIEQCLHANPDDRFTNMDDLYAALDSWKPEPATDMVEPGQVKRLASLPHRLATYVRAFFQQTDHFGQLRQWAEKRRLSRKSCLYRILAVVDLDASEHMNLEILRQAQQKARQHPSLITVISVLSVDVGLSSGEEEEHFVNEQLVKARKTIGTLLHKAGPPLTPVGVNVVTGYYPVDAINQCVKEYGIDLVVIGCRQKNWLARFMQNRVVYSILPSVSDSVLLVPAP